MKIREKEAKGQSMKINEIRAQTATKQTIHFSVKNQAALQRS